MSEEKATYSADQIQLRKAEQNALYKYAAIKHAESDIVGAARIYIDMTGDWEAALVLDELMFWTLPKSKTGKTSLRVQRDGFSWLAVQRTDWWERKRLTARQADNAIKKLIDQELVVKELYKFNAQPTTHLRLNIKKFFTLLMESMEKSYKDDEYEESMKDIQDLYEMMGIAPIHQTVIPDSPNGETDSPNGETDSPNGEMINSPDQPALSPLKPWDEKFSNMPLDWLIASGMEIPQSLIDSLQARKLATDTFEKVFGFGSLPWASNTTWEKFYKWVVKIHAEHPTMFQEYVDWSKGDGKYKFMSNKQIRMNPLTFIDTGYPEFEAAKMYAKPKPAAPTTPLPDMPAGWQRIYDNA